MRRGAKKIFRGKILLFGEHLINKNGTGLAVPVDTFYGHLDILKEQPSEADLNSFRSIERLYNFTKSNTTLRKVIDIEQFKLELENGLFFKSNIPEGYGVGSSGSLVAALYNAFRINRNEKDLYKIKEILSSLESFFHGKSSGLDPIVSYTDKTVLVKNTEIEIFEFKPTESSLKVYLIDTKISRSTSEWVKLFLRKCKNENFLAMVEKSMIPASNNCINNFLKNDFKKLQNGIKLISQLQWDYMREFIPIEFHETWKNSLRENEFSLKICGAGGGGFILCFTTHESSFLQKMIHQKTLKIL